MKFHGISIVTLFSAVFCAENCVDISRYQEIEYNVTKTELCTFSVVKECQPRSRRVCTTVEETLCEAGAFTEQDMRTAEHTVPADHTLELTYVQKVCSPKETQLVEQKMMPQCKNVTKEQCDSKWVINSEGEKVWAGNENCKNVTWQDCSLQLVNVTQDVNSWDCQDGEPIEYVQPAKKNVKVETMETSCTTEAYPDCETSKREACAEVEWQECKDSIVTKCFPVEYEVPFQRYDHRLRCTVAH